MKHRYPDLLRFGTPYWYDQNGAPRFCNFAPELCPCIYAKQCCLMEVMCQACGKKFDVEMHWWSMDGATDLEQRLLVSQGVEPYSSHLHYGDPPNHQCTGDAMTCSDLRVIEFWQRESFGAWERRHELEVQLEIHEAAPNEKPEQASSGM